MGIPTSLWRPRELGKCAGSFSYELELCALGFDCGSSTAMLRTGAWRADEIRDLSFSSLTIWSICLLFSELAD